MYGTLQRQRVLAATSEGWRLLTIVRLCNMCSNPFNCSPDKYHKYIIQNTGVGNTGHLLYIVTFSNMNVVYWISLNRRKKSILTTLSRQTKLLLFFVKIQTPELTTHTMRKLCPWRFLSLWFRF